MRGARSASGSSSLAVVVRETFRDSPANERAFVSEMGSAAGTLDRSIHSFVGDPMEG